MDNSDGDVAMSALCALCFLYLLVIVRLLVIPLLICGFGFFVVPVAVLLVLFVVTTHTHTHCTSRMTQKIPNVRERQSGPKSDRANEGRAVPFPNFYSPSICLCTICLHVRCVRPDTRALLIVTASPSTENHD